MFVIQQWRGYDEFRYGPAPLRVHLQHMAREAALTTGEEMALCAA